MNKLLREIEQESGLEIYGLGARRDKWEYTIEKFTERVIQECLDVIATTDTRQAYTSYDLNLVQATMSKIENKVKTHFGIDNTLS